VLYRGREVNDPETMGAFEMYALWWQGVLLECPGIGGCFTDRGKVPRVHEIGA
jgi:hypothetical protein